MPNEPLTKISTRSISVPAVATPAFASMFPTHEEISRRAYEIYLARGQANGHAHEDWAQAERELLAKAHRNN